MDRRPAALTLAVLAALTLAACTGAPTASPATSAATAAPSDAPGDDGQTTAEGCALMQESIDSASDAFASASPEDTESVVDAMRSASQELTRVSEQVTNDEVAALLPPLRDMFARAADAIQAVAEGDAAGADDVGDIASSFSEASGRYQDLCDTGT